MFDQFAAKTGSILNSVASDLSGFTKMLAVLSAFLVPLHGIVGIMMFFLVADTLSAIYLRYRLVKARWDCDDKTTKDRMSCLALFWKVIDRDKFDKTIEKLFAYPAVALVCFVFDVMVLDIRPGEDGELLKFSLTSLMFMLICFIDMRSFLRNMGKATRSPVYGFIEKALDRKIKDRLPTEKQKK